MPLSILVNKKRFPIILILLLLSTGSVIWIFHNAVLQEAGLGYYIYYLIVSSISLYITIRHSYNYLYAVFSNRARLLVSDTGINDTLTIYSIGHVDWDDITLVERKKVLGIEVLLIMIKNPDLVISKQSKWKQAYLRRLNRKWNTPIAISQRIIDFDIDSLTSIIKGYLNQNTARNKQLLSKE